MKNRFLYIVLVLLSMTIGVSAQDSFQSLSSTQKTKYLLDKSKEVVETFGKGYYRSFDTPSVTVCKYDAGVGGDNVMRSFNGKEYYEIVSYYDKEKECFEMPYLYKVWIWKDNGLPFAVFFGNGGGLNFFDIPYEELAKISDEYQIKFEKLK